MDQAHGMPSRCLARLHLTAAEVAWLTDRPHAAHEVDTEQGCVLEIGHADPHAAMAQQSPAAEWWVRWTLAASEVVTMAGCPAVSATATDSCGDPSLCLFYRDHPGRHSFELAPWASTPHGQPHR